MADINPIEPAGYSAEVLVRPCNWGAIWSGTFTFIAIWAIFEALGVAIFGSAAGAGASHTGLNVGMVAWSVILTIISMFVAGRVTGQLAGLQNSVRTHAMIMFGLSVVASLVILALAANPFTTGRAAEAPGLLGELFGADAGWPTFIALFLGWLAAMGGASTAHKELTRAEVFGHQTTHAPSHAG